MLSRELRDTSSALSVNILFIWTLIVVGCFSQATKQTCYTNHIKSFRHVFVYVTPGGCNGSTAFAHFLSDLLRLHGITSYPVSNECLKPWNNPFFEQADCNLTRATEMLVHDAEQRKMLLIMKATVSQLSQPGILPVLNASNASIIVYYRKDVMRRLVCIIRDCLYSQHVLSYPGYPVLSNGIRTRLCFERRRSPIHVQAFINVSTLPSNVLLLQASTSHWEERLPLQYRTAPIFSFEDLFAFEYTDKSATLSYLAWHGILTLANLPTECLWEWLLSRSSTRELEDMSDLVYDWNRINSFNSHVVASVDDSEEWDRRVLFAYSDPRTSPSSRVRCAMMTNGQRPLGNNSTTYLSGESISEQAKP